MLSVTRVPGFKGLGVSSEQRSIASQRREGAIAPTDLSLKWRGVFCLFIAIIFEVAGWSQAARRSELPSREVEQLYGNLPSMESAKKQGRTKEYQEYKKEFDALMAQCGSLKKSELNSLLSYCAQLGLSECIRPLVQCGADPNFRPSPGDRTPILRNANSLHCSCETVLTLLDCGASLDAKTDGNDDFWTLVDLSIRNGLEGCRELKSCVAWWRDKKGWVQAITKNNLEWANKDGMTALLAAVKSNDVPFVKELLAKGANANAGNSFGNNALIFAADQRNSELVTLLLEAGCDPNKKNGLGATALIVASEMGHAEIASLLIRKGADVNVKTNKGQTPLMWAAIKGNRGVAEILLSSGADISATDNDGKTAYQLAADNRNKALADLVFSKAGGSGSACADVFIAVDKGDREKAHEALTKCSDPNRKSSTGSTLLIALAEYGDLALVQEAVSKGAKVNDKNSEGRDALMQAASLNKKDIVRFLLEKGADVTAKDADGENALTLAGALGMNEVVQMLRNAGAQGVIRPTFRVMLQATGPSEVAKARVMITDGKTTWERVLMRPGNSYFPSGVTLKSETGSLRVVAQNDLDNDVIGIRIVLWRAGEKVSEASCVGRWCTASCGYP